MKIALANYNDERQYVKELPQVCDIPDLYGFAENGLGVAAFENEKMIGFLCCCEPFDNAFRSTDVRGIFSPMGANAAVSKNRLGQFPMQSAYTPMMKNFSSSFSVMVSACAV